MFAPLQRFRRYGFGAIAGTCLAAVSLASASTTLTVEEVALNDANNGMIAVSFQSDTAVAAAQMDMIFDPAAYLSSSAGAGTLPENYRVDSHLVEPGRLRVVVGARNNPSFPNGALFQVPLTATSSFGSSFPLRLTSMKLSTAGSSAVETQIAPSVGLLGLTNGQAIDGRSGIQLTVETNATDGSIVRVEYYANGLKIGENTVTPFGFFWRPSVSGTFAVQAVAFDTHGLQTSSRRISIEVTGIPLPTPTPSPTPVTTSSPMATATVTPAMTPTSTPTATATPTATSTATPTATPTPSPTPVTTSSPTATATVTPAMTPTSTPTATATPTATSTATPTSTPTATPVATPTPNPTATATATATATPTTPSRLVNISARLGVQTKDDVLIAGFIVTGSQPKRVILRGIGPSLAAAGLADALSDPELELFNGSGASITYNNNWLENANAQQILASTLAPRNVAEAALLVSLDPGIYTAILRGVNDTTGVGLIELYDLDLTADSKFANISTRGFVQTGDDVLIGGMIVVGGSPQKVIIRAIGPSLAHAGVPKALADPTLELHDSNGSIIGFNDNWRSDQEREIIATTIPPSDNAESAIVKMLAPGNYTAIVGGATGSTGVALVEVYALP